MKKLLMFSILLMFPLFARADLMGFMDGMGLWDEKGVQQYTCFKDNSCVGLDNKIYSKPELLGTKMPDPVPPATTQAPPIIPQPVGVVLPTNQPTTMPTEPVRNDNLTVPVKVTYPVDDRRIYFSFTGDGHGEVVFNNRTILKDNLNQVEFTLKGSPSSPDGTTTYPVGSRDFVALNDEFVPGNTYTYDYIYNGQITTKHFSWDQASGMRVW